MPAAIFFSFPNICIHTCIYHEMWWKSMHIDVHIRYFVHAFSHYWLMKLPKIERKFDSEARNAFFSTAPIDSIETLMKQFRFMQFIFFFYISFPGIDATNWVASAVDRLAIESQWFQSIWEEHRLVIVVFANESPQKCYVGLKICTGFGKIYRFYWTIYGIRLSSIKLHKIYLCNGWIDGRLSGLTFFNSAETMIFYAHLQYTLP